MIILDTNVVSEPLKPQPDLNVLTWLDRQAPETLYLTTTSLAELLSGAALTPHGKRKAAFQNELTLLIDHLFESRVLPFNQPAAVAFAAIFARTRQKGHTVLIADAQIAAIAESLNFAVATRNIKPFLAAGIRVIEPWKS